MKKLLIFTLVLSLILPLIVLFYQHINSSTNYNLGAHSLNGKVSTTGIMKACVIIYLVLLLTAIGILLFFIYKKRFKEVSMLILILAISFLVSGWINGKYQPGYAYLMEGFEGAVRDKISFGDIKEWISSFQASKPTEWLDKNKWPEFISSLSPNDVVIDTIQENKKYVRLIWGGPPGHYGVVVGIDSKTLPMDVFFISEYRKDIEENAFIYHELKRK